MITEVFQSGKFYGVTVEDRSDVYTFDCHGEDAAHALKFVLDCSVKIIDHEKIGEI